MRVMSGIATETVERIVYCIKKEPGTQSFRKGRRKTISCRLQYNLGRASRFGITRNTLYTIQKFFYHVGMMLHPFNGSRTDDFWTVRFATEHRLSDLADTPLSDETIPKEIPHSEPIAANLPPQALLEAALFLAKEPMPSRRLAQLAGLPEGKGTSPQHLIRELNKRYDRNRSAFCVVEVAEGFQLRTRPEFAPWLARLQGVPAAVRLSNPAMETLTVIAYRQPIPRTEVERIRGVQCGDLIRQLLDQDLAKIVGRSEELGRPFLYGTTPKFLKTFGLASLNDLPALMSEQS